MRHRRQGRKLNRTASHRKALFRNLANQLFEHKEIKTTVAKAKEARSIVERMITYAKKGDMHHRRLAFAFLRQKTSINTLFDEIAPTYTDRQGGYTRIIKLGKRIGDGAPVCILQLVDFEKLADSSKTEKKKKSKEKSGKVKEAKKEEISDIKTEKEEKNIEEKAESIKETEEDVKSEEKSSEEFSIEKEEENVEAENETVEKIEEIKEDIKTEEKSSDEPPEEQEDEKSEEKEK